MPDDGAVQGFARGAIPSEGGLALVGQADGGDADGAAGGGGAVGSCCELGLFEGAREALDDGAPDLLRVVLAPAVCLFVGVAAFRFNTSFCDTASES